MLNRIQLLTAASAMALAAPMALAQGDRPDAKPATAVQIAAEAPMTMKSMSTQNADSAFRTRLAAEYRSLSSYEKRRMWDFSSSEYYADKARKVESGVDAIPAVPQVWPVNKASLPDLTEGRAKLIQAFSQNARTLAPNEAAVAQAKYDCWVEQTSEGLTSEGTAMPWQPRDIAACKDQFRAAMADLEHAIAAAKPAPAPAPKVTTAAPPKPAPTYRATSDRATVYFDFDKATLSPGAKRTIAKLAAKLKGDTKIVVTVTGHTDRAGSSKYNEMLSRKRAVAVKDELSRLGLDVRRLAELNLKAEGENAPAVATADGVPNQLNRRAVIQAYARQTASSENRVSQKP